MPHSRRLRAHRVNALRPAAYSAIQHFLAHSLKLAAPLAGIAASCVVSAAMAQDSGVRLPTLHVDGARPVGEAIRMNEVAPVVPVAREEFETLPNDRVSDIVGRLPGVVVSGPPGEKKSFSLRGLPADYTRVSIDGLSLPGPSRAFELMNMSSFLAGEVTLVRNPSAEYEAEGVAGRIAVTPRAIPATPEGEIRVGYGGLNGFNGGVRNVGGGYGLRRGDFGMIGALSYEERSLTKIKNNSEFTFSGGPDGQGFRRNEEEPQDVANLDATLDLAGFYDSGEIHLKPVVLRERSEVSKWRDQYRRVTGQQVDRTLTSGSQDALNYGVTLDHTHRFDGGATLRSQFNVSRADYSTRNRETTLTPAGVFSAAAETRSAYDENLLQAGSTLTVPTTLGGLPHQIKTGVLVKAARRDSDGDSYTLNAAGTASQTAANRLTSLQADYQITERYYAAFAQDQITWGELTLTPGLRVERVTNQLSGYNGRSDVDTTDLFPSLPLRYRLNEQWILRGAASRQISRPKFEDMAPGITQRGSRLYYGSPDVRPTRSWSFDAGAEYHGDGFFLAANLFHRQVRDVIEAEEVATNRLVVRNVGDGYARGLELEQRFNFGLIDPALKPLTLFANQTFLRTEVNDPATGKRPFAETPDVTGNIGLTWNDREQGTILSASINASGERLVVSNEGTGQIRRKTRRAEAFIDLYAEQRVIEGFSLFAQVENLTDKARSEYEVTNGTLSREAEIASGRTVVVGGRLRF